jgi:phosphoglycolate phosphatase-like HAD superfamily hydrolase
MTPSTGGNGALPFTVYLFDVDGTLVNAGGAGRRAFEQALHDRCGRRESPPLGGLRLDGLTDRLIARKALELLGLPFDDAFCDDILARYIEHLHAEIEGPGYAVLPGVLPLLEALRARAALVALCTGNVVEGARLKLRRGGLDRYFDWSASAVFGFASDGEEREKLVRAALGRAAVRLGRAVAPRSAIVVGDTPRDVAAAHHAGCTVLGVATGRFSVDELRACGADHVAPTLEDGDAVRVLLGRAPPAP